MNIIGTLKQQTFYQQMEDKVDDDDDDLEICWFRLLQY